MTYRDCKKYKTKKVCSQLAIPCSLGELDFNNRADMNLDNGFIFIEELLVNAVKETLIL